MDYIIKHFSFYVQFHSVSVYGWALDLVRKTQDVIHAIPKIEVVRRLVERIALIDKVNLLEEAAQQIQLDLKSCLGSGFLEKGLKAEPRYSNTFKK